MKETRILAFITVILIAITLLGTPVLAPLEYTKTILYFNVQALQEVTVTLVNEGTGTITAGGAGNNTSSALNFTCAATSCYWINASLSGGGGTQNDGTPAVNVINTGTSTCQLNITSNTSATFGGDSCLTLYFSNNTISYPPTLNLNSTLNVTLDGSLLALEELDIWLFGNFSGCAEQAYIGAFFAYAYWS